MYQLLSVFDVEVEDQELGGVVMTNLEAPLSACGIKPNGKYTMKKRSQAPIQPAQATTVDQQQQQMMHNRLMANFQTVVAWEDSTSQAKALSIIPLDELRERAKANPAALPGCFILWLH